jgi:hypothetical protein
MAAPFSYTNPSVPEGYACSVCGATGCKLWRPYQTFDPALLCLKHTCERAKIPIEEIASDGKHDGSDGIGWYVPAVPTEENDTYWGYTSVPDMGVYWWNSLPLVAERLAE